MTDYVTSADGTRIGYDRYGSGPAVILVGGAFQHRETDPQTSDLAYALGTRGFTVLNYDRRGRGDSPAPGPTTLDHELADLAALIGVAGGEAALYGSSSGSAIALAAAARGLPVTHLALWEPPLGPAEQTDGAEFHAGLVDTIAAGDGDAIVRYFMRDMPPEWVQSAEASAVWPTMVAVGPSLAGDAAALAWTQSAPRDRLFAPIGVPVQVLLGVETLPLFSGAAESILAAMPQAVEVRVAGADHQWELDAMTTTLAEFFSRSGQLRGVRSVEGGPVS